MKSTPIIIQPGMRTGTVQVPFSKSHLHRLLIADFLAGGDHFRKKLVQRRAHHSGEI